jgi:hypothetical protein
MADGDAGGDSGAAGSASESNPGDTGTDDGIATGTLSMGASDENLGDNEFQKLIPAEYRDKPYLKDIDSPDKLFKQFDNAQQLIGRKNATVPAQDAAETDWEKYYETTRPENADAYQFADPELDADDKQILDYLNQTKNEDFEKEVKGLMFKHGMTKKQAESFAKDYTKALVTKSRDTLKAQIDSAKLLNQDFTERAKKNWGADTDKVLNRGKEYIGKYASPETKQLLNHMDNAGLIVLTEVIEGMHRDYVKGDSLTPSKDTSAGTSESIRKQAYALQSELMKNGSQQFDPNYDDKRKRVTELYAQADSLKRKGM